MRRKIKNRNKVEADPVYQSAKISKLVNYVMEAGKKNIARGVIYGVLEDIKTRLIPSTDTRL